MMRPDNAGPEVYLCRDPVDFRKGINGLAAMVEGSMGHGPSPSACSCSATGAGIG